MGIEIGNLPRIRKMDGSEYVFRAFRVREGLSGKVSLSRGLTLDEASNRTGLSPRTLQEIGFGETELNVDLLRRTLEENLLLKPGHGKRGEAEDRIKRVTEVEEEVKAIFEGERQRAMGQTDKSAQAAMKKLTLDEKTGIRERVLENMPLDLHLALEVPTALQPRYLRDKAKTVQNAFEALVGKTADEGAVLERIPLKPLSEITDQTERTLTLVLMVMEESIRRNGTEHGMSDSDILDYAADQTSSLFADEITKTRFLKEFANVYSYSRYPLNPAAQGGFVAANAKRAFPDDREAQTRYIIDLVGIREEVELERRKSLVEIASDRGGKLIPNKVAENPPKKVVKVYTINLSRVAFLAGAIRVIFSDCQVETQEMQVASALLEIIHPTSDDFTRALAEAVKAMHPEDLSAQEGMVAHAIQYLGEGGKPEDILVGVARNLFPSNPLLQEAFIVGSINALTELSNGAISPNDTIGITTRAANKLYPQDAHSQARVIALELYTNSAGERVRVLIDEAADALYKSDPPNRALFVERIRSALKSIDATLATIAAEEARVTAGRAA